MTERRACPVASAAESQGLNLAGEMRRLKHILAICRSCERSTGNCRRMKSIRTEVQDILTVLLLEMVLDGE